MDLHKPTLANKVGKYLAPAFSRIACSSWLHKPVRAADAYINFLLGKGAGAGWNISEEVKTASEHVHRPAPVIFDVGANVGDWGSALLRGIPSARLFLFEPSPECQAHIQGLHLPGTRLVPCAVGESNGKATLHTSSGLDASASLHARNETYFQDRIYHSIEVETVTLDSVIQDEGIAFVDFLKMDIEGHELAALRGSAAALASQKIGALSFEFGSGNINSRTFFRDFWDLLTSHGFKIGRITPGGTLLETTAYYEDLEYFRGVSNYVAVLKEHPFRGRTSQA